MTYAESGPRLGLGQVRCWSTVRVGSAWLIHRTDHQLLFCNEEEETPGEKSPTMFIAGIRYMWVYLANSCIRSKDF